MLKLPVKVVLIIVATSAILLGAHGIWAWLNVENLFMGGTASKLFLSIEVPLQLQPPILWMSGIGLKANLNPFLLVAPIGLIILGLAVFGTQGSIYLGFRLPKWLRWLW